MMVSTRTVALTRPYRARAGCSHRLARQAGHDRLRQRDRADICGRPAMLPAGAHGMTFHRSRQAHAERLHRGLQRKLRI